MIGDVGERQLSAPADWRQAVDTLVNAGLIEQPAREIAEVVGAEADSVPTAVAAFRLQDETDYRAALREWLRPVRIGGHLVLLVPHAFLRERQLALPAPHDARQRRLYTPRVLLEELEEALPPNSYRVRHLADLDAGHDYGAAGTMPAAGEGAILLVLQKISPPDWAPLHVARQFVSPPEPSAPDYAFVPERTRVEIAPRGASDIRRIFVIKPDHLGDLVMSLSALQRLRELFPEAHVTLLVGSWNAEMARSLGLADEVIGFDVFPRNSSEEEVDVAGRAALFRAAVTGRFDLAIDLRCDTDTRALLRLVDAPVRAGIGTRAQFPFLDIFLPLDFNRNWTEAAGETLFTHKDFATQGPVQRSEFRSVFEADRAERQHAIVWGPYRRLRAGRYLFDPHVEFAPGQSGMLLFDIALDTRRATRLFVDGSGPLRLAFSVESFDAEFEFRVFTVDGEPPLSFSFFGGRLIREGAQSVLHQSEYQRLLIELIAIRLARTGLLSEAALP